MPAEVPLQPLVQCVLQGRVSGQFFWGKDTCVVFTSGGLLAPHCKALHVARAPFLEFAGSLLADSLQALCWGRLQVDILLLPERPLGEV